MSNWRRTDTPTTRRTMVPSALNKTPRCAESYPEGATHRTNMPKARVGRGSRMQSGMGAKNQNLRAKM